MTSYTLSSQDFAPRAFSEQAAPLDATSGLSNLLSSMRAYADMSPDFAIRRDVNAALKGRPRQALTEYAWVNLFAEQLTGNAVKAGDARAVLEFIYAYFGEYTGIEFGRVRPSDRLIEDLHLPLVCWFDWALTLCEDLLVQFDVDLSDRFDETHFETMGELAVYLAEQIALAHTAGHGDGLLHAVVNPRG